MSVRRSPHVILDPQELQEVVAHLRHSPNFVLDIETTKAGARANELLWVGLGASGHVFLIPVRHPKGVQIKPERKQKTAAFILFGPDDPRGRTKTGQPSMRMVEHTVPAVFAPPPKQMYADQVCEIIRPLIYGDQGKVGHNVKFDLMSLAKYYGDEIPPPPYHDTLIMTHCLDEDLQSYSLKDLTGDWFGIPWKQRPKWYPNLGEKGIESFGLDQVARYLAKDLRYAWMRFRFLYPKLKRDAVLNTYEFEMSIYPAIMAMEYAGFPVDLTKIDTVRADLERQIMEVEHTAWSLADGEFSLSHLETKRWVLFGEGRPMFGKAKNHPLKTQQLPVISRTEKGNVAQVTQEVLEAFADRGNKMASTLLEWSTLEKLRGTFIGAPAHIKVEKGQEVAVPASGVYSRLVHGPGPLPTVHTSFKQHGTKTGRLSAADPNLQQLPRGSTIRSLFVAPEGSILIVADYDQIELRVAGYLSEDPAMNYVFEQGEDIHRRAAAVMFQVDPEKVTGDQRSVGKTQNFAVLYGAGEDKIAAVAHCSTRRAKSLIENYYAEFAALEPWKNRLLRDARKSGNKFAPYQEPPYVLIPPYGRKRRIPFLYHEKYGLMRKAERQAVNAKVQGFAASITKMAMRDLLEVLRPYPARMLAQVHDEIVVCCDESAVGDVLPLVEQVMGGVRDPHDDTPILGAVPLVVSAADGRSWAEAKAKG